MSQNNSINSPLPTRHERGGLEADVSAYDGYIRIAGGTTTNIKCNFGGTTAPVVGDDSADGYVVGSRWIDTTNDKEYVCTDNSAGAAVWKETSNATSSGITASQAFALQMIFGDD